MGADRRQARVLAMQALCQWEVQHDTSSPSLIDFLERETDRRSVLTYALSLAESFWKEHGPIDTMIAGAADKWDFSRISTVERNIMRVAVVEMLGGDVPRKVALNEAIEIGREFGGADSPRFINGVLDKVFHDLPGTMGESE